MLVSAILASHMPDEEEHSPIVVTPEKSEKGDFWQFSAELIKTALVVAVLAYVIRLFVIQPFIVDGSSMFPRFQTNDYLLVDKVSYRFHTPNRGDIVVFKYPLDTSVNYVKRIIGLPGETVRIQNGTVSILSGNQAQGTSLTEPYINGGAKTLLPSEAAQADFVVPTGHYFVLGDNRPASSDSREWGLLPQEDIIGKVIVQAYPLSRLHVVSAQTY